MKMALSCGCNNLSDIESFIKEKKLVLTNVSDAGNSDIQQDLMGPPAWGKLQERCIEKREQLALQQPTLVEPV